MGKVVLISGASAGIGRACADRLAKAQWVVYGASRRGSASQNWQGLCMDVDDDASVAAGVDRVRQDQGRIDAVVAAAGWGLAGPAEHTPVAQAKEQLETNFFGVVRLVHQVLPDLRRQGRGHLVLVGSIGGVIGLPFQSFYSAAKFALEGYAEALAHEVAPFGIQVTVVEPGNVRTEFTANRREIATGPHDPYAAASHKALEVMARDEAHGVAPEAVAATVDRVLASARPPRRVSVGRASERVGIVAKRVMPYRLFEWAAKSSLGV